MARGIVRSTECLLLAVFTKVTAVH